MRKAIKIKDLGEVITGILHQDLIPDYMVDIHRLLKLQILKNLQNLHIFLKNFILK